MDKTYDSNIIASHEIKVIDRNGITLTGIKKISSFDNEEFLMDSTLGGILLKGENLEIIKLDTHDGNVKIKGKINSFTYLDSKIKTKDNGLLVKLFK